MAYFAFWQSFGVSLDFSLGVIQGLQVFCSFTPMVIAFLRPRRTGHNKSREGRDPKDQWADIHTVFLIIVHASPSMYAIVYLAFWQNFIGVRKFSVSSYTTEL